MATADDAFDNALRSYWNVRSSQRSTGLGEGAGADVRGGKHFDDLQRLVANVFLDAGFSEQQIFLGRTATLPGYFRPTKAWDLVVVADDVLVAAFELKSLGGPSFGNNFNNRAEEAVGNATDLRRAYSAGSLGSIEPWLGYFFLVEDAPRSRVPVAARVSAGSLAPEFAGLSYCGRAEALCDRLKREGLYDAVCFAASSRDPADPPRDPNPSLGWDTFVAAIHARIGYLTSLGVVR